MSTGSKIGGRQRGLWVIRSLISVLILAPLLLASESSARGKVLMASQGSTQTASSAARSQDLNGSSPGQTQQQIINSFPDEGNASILGAGLTPSAGTAAPRVAIALSGFNAFVFLGSPFAGVPGSDGKLSDLPSPLLPRTPKPGCNYYANVLPLQIIAVDVDEASHTYNSIGNFKSTHVQIQAFGSIPAAATLTLTQPIENGKVVPLSGLSYQQGTSIKKSDPPDAAYGGCDPVWEAEFPSQLVIVTGQIDVSISDVSIDKVPLDVGASCQTAQPLQVRLIGLPNTLGGTYGSNALEGGELIQKEDTSTTSGPEKLGLYPDSHDLDIPAFSGCRSASGEDVSRLMTALVSGPGNTLSVNQQAPLFTIPPLDAPTLCDFSGSCATPPDALPPPPFK